MVTYRNVLMEGPQWKAQQSFAGPIGNNQPERRGVQLDATFVSTPLYHRLARTGNLNPYRQEKNEVLPPCYGRNYHGLLVHYITKGPIVNLDTVQIE
jgi:hypothetical protein